MLPFFALSIGAFVLFCVMAAMPPMERIFHAYDSKIKSERISVIGGAVRSRYLENPAGGLIAPADLALIPGYEYLDSYKAEIFQTGNAQNINDSVWRFSRFAIWFPSTGMDIDPATYLDAANNSCGTGTFASATSWCGNSKSLWAKYETRIENGSLLMGEKARLVKVVSKFYRRYSADRKFTSLANGSYATLASLTGYAGVATGCTGVRTYDGIPFTCDELFNAWGVPIVVNQVTAKRIALVNRTGVINSNGQPVRLAEEAALE